MTTFGQLDQDAIPAESQPLLDQMQKSTQGIWDVG